MSSDPQYPLELPPDEMRALAGAALDRIVAHIESLPKQALSDTRGGFELARSLVEPLPETGVPVSELLDLIFERAVKLTYNTASPGYLAYIPGGGLFHAAGGGPDRRLDQPLHLGLRDRAGPGPARSQRGRLVLPDRRLPSRSPGHAHQRRLARQLDGPGDGPARPAARGLPQGGPLRLRPGPLLRGQGRHPRRLPRGERAVRAHGRPLPPAPRRPRSPDRGGPRAAASPPSWSSRAPAPPTRAPSIPCPSWPTSRHGTACGSTWTRPTAGSSC